MKLTVRSGEEDLKRVIMPGLTLRNARLVFKPNMQAGLQAKQRGLGGLALKARGKTLN